MEKQLSIVVPCYNIAKYLPATLDSILLRQNFLSMEVILVNDGSTDDTFDIIKTYQKRYENIVYYLNIDNCGVSNARNLGLQRAVGEYILFIDGDDMLFDNILSQWMEHIYSNQLDMSFVGYEERYWKEEKGFKKNRNYLEGIYSGEEILIKKLKKQIWICSGNVIYRTKILRNNNLIYNTSYKYGEDAEFIGKCLLNSKRVASLNKQGLIIITRDSSALSTVSFEKYKDAVYAFKDLQNYAFNLPVSSALKNALEFDYLNLYLGLVKILFSHSEQCDKKLKNELEGIELPCWKTSVSLKKRIEIILYTWTPVLYFNVIHVYYLLTRNRWNIK